MQVSNKFIEVYVNGKVATVFFKYTLFTASSTKVRSINFLGLYVNIF